MKNIEIFKEGTFNPDKEVRKLLSIPREQRREAVFVFKDKLARQREAWALCRTTIEERIEANPDIPREEMIGIIGQFASSYGFAQPHIEIAKQLIDDYISQRERVAEIRGKYPDNIALINRLTGLKFTKADTKDFTVRVGPISLEIFCSGFNAGKIHEKSKNPIVGFNCSGFASQSSGSKPIYYLVVNNDYSSSDPYAHATTVPHEREHQKNRILKPRQYGISEVHADVREMSNRGVSGFLKHRVGERLLGLKRNFRDEVFYGYESTRDPREKALLLGEFMRLERERALNSAKNEIIAMKSEPYDVYGGKYNIFLKQNGDTYDYSADLRNWDKKKADPLWQETSKRVLVDGYRDIIDNAIVAFDQLRGSGYSQAETIAMLSDKRLADWPKTVRRLIEEKNN